MLAAALMICPPVFFLPFLRLALSKEPQAPIKIPSTLRLALVTHVTARHRREAKGAKRVNEQYLLVLL